MTLCSRSSTRPKTNSRERHRPHRTPRRVVRAAHRWVRCVVVGPSLTWALVGLCVLLGGLLSPSLIWLHGETQEGKHLRDRLDEEMKLGAQYRSERDVEVAAHAVTKDLLEKERNLRPVAEAARTEAQGRP